MSSEYNSTENRPNADINGATRAGKKSRKGREYKTYNYDPLPRSRGTIRILELLPSEKSESDVLCALITPEEDERAKYPYEALSWCWGTGGKNDYIRVQRNRKTYNKYVSHNLVAAMKALRYPDRSRYLWIDMVCIDQDNLNEKNHQVEMMDIIYGNAERVCIWLGEANESSRMALSFIKHEVSHLQSFDTLCDSQNASKKWVALLDLMQRPWFSRRWVVQELALAQKPIIYCGNDRISWKKFAIAVELFVEVETATHRLSEVMKKDRQYQYIPSYFDYVSALGASLLVDATERLFRDYQAVEVVQPTTNTKPVEIYSDSESDTSGEASDSEDSDSSSHKNSAAAHGVRRISKNRIQPLLSLEYLVSSLTIFDTTVPHDTIYALLAIAKDTTPRAVASGEVVTSRGASQGLEIYTQRKSYNVDYKLPYVDVCKDFISFSIERSLEGNSSRALDVICRPWAIEERTLKKLREEKKSKKEKEERDTRRKREREQQREWRQGRGAHSPPPRLSASGVIDNAFAPEDDPDDMPLPSWVPQLSSAPHAMAQRPGLTGPKMSRINADPLVGLPSLTQRNYSAAETKGVDMKALRFRKRSSLGHFSMYVRGFQLDVIKEVEQVARNGQIPREWAELVGWADAKGHPPDAFWRTLVANRGREGKNPPVYYSRACQESFKKGGLESGAVDTTALIDYERNSVVAQFCRRVQAVTWNRALIRTKFGRFGLVGRDVEKGDRVCILYGCSVPVILRESPKKTEDMFKKEMEEELKDIKNTVVQNFRRYMSRKRRHEMRKDLEMALICRRWFKATDYIRTHGLKSRKPTDEENKVECLRILREAIAAFKVWWLQERLEQWSGVKSRQEQDREEAKTKKSKPGKKEMDELLHKQSAKQEMEEARAQKPRERRKSRSAADIQQEIVPTKTFSVGGAGLGTSKTPSSATKKRRSVIDWWAFEYALAAGRRWKQIVKERKDERAAFAFKKSEADWIQQQRENYDSFCTMRIEQNLWVGNKPTKIKVGDTIVQSNGINNQNNTKDSAYGEEESSVTNPGVDTTLRLAEGPREASEDEHLDSSETAGERAHPDTSYTDAKHEHNQPLRETEVVESGVLMGDSGASDQNDLLLEDAHQIDDNRMPTVQRVYTNSHKPLEVHFELSPTNTGPHPLPSLTIERKSLKQLAKVRPSWAGRENTERLSVDEGEKYNQKILNNLRERLGEEGYFSYTLLGECYIHGVMDGEAMLYQNEGDDKVVPSMVFEIR